MIRFTFALLAALSAGVPAFAADNADNAAAVPPPSPGVDRMRDFQNIVLAPKVFGALAEPVKSITVVDPAAHAFEVKSENCTLPVKVVYKSMGGGSGSEISVEVGRARCH